MNLVPDRNGSTRKLVLLAPPDNHSLDAWSSSRINAIRYSNLLANMQKMRGKIYREEGALRQDQLTRDGRHMVPADDKAWHILSVDQEDEIIACARYTAHENCVSFDELGLVESDLAQSRKWGGALRSAVELEIKLARQLNLAYVEVGGWAVSPKVGNSCEALRIALGSYSLARILGGCVGIGTVTQRNMSSSILRRLGGRSVLAGGRELPAYYDTSYGCQMEILGFESARPNPRYEKWIDDLQTHLLTVEVISKPPSTSIANLASALSREEMFSRQMDLADSRKEKSAVRRDRYGLSLAR